MINVIKIHLPETCSIIPFRIFNKNHIFFLQQTNEINNKGSTKNTNIMSKIKTKTYQSDV